MSDFQIPEPNYFSKPSADIILAPDEKGIVQSESFPVIPRNNSKNDFMRPVKMSDIIKINDIARNQKRKQFGWDELGIGITTLGFGSSLSALASNLQLNGALGIVFYIISPVVSFSCLIFVIMYKVLRREKATRTADMICSIIEEYIDDGNGVNEDES